MKHTRLGYWIEEAGKAEPRAPLAGDREADVLVVGGGYTGMWTALYARQLEPEARVVLLEAEPVCGRGPSGRNGGFCNAMWFSLATMRDRWGAEAALATAHAAQEAVERIKAFCDEQEVDAWFRPAGYVQVSTAPCHPPPRPLVAAGATGRRLPRQRPHGRPPRPGPRPRPAEDPPLGALGAAAAASPGGAMGLARDPLTTVTIASRHGQT
jgi:choline dehydrogenase-like flavoprotein